MRIENISDKDIELLSKIGAESFIDNQFYKNFKKNGQLGKTELENIFKKSIKICIDYGFAQKIVLNEKPCAFILAFNYWDLKKNNNDLFNHFFRYNTPFVNKKLTNVDNAIVNSMQKNADYIYLLAVAVDKEFRRKGMAMKLVNKICNDCSEYNIITDVSDKNMLHICESLGFNKTPYNIENCNILTKSPTATICELNVDNIMVAVPSNSNYLSGYVKIGTYLLANVTALNDSYVFTKCFENSCEVSIYNIDRSSLLCMQSSMNLSEILEQSFYYNDMSCLYYCNQYSKHFEESTTTLQESLSSKMSNEDKIHPDICTSIPMSYKNIDAIINNPNSFYASKIIEALDFRTEYESGVPLYDSGDANFKNRIMRVSLGKIKIQITTEKELKFGCKCLPENIGKPFDGILMLSMDVASKICVLHLLSISFGNKVTQYLDCVSRNQINIVLEDGKLVNFYKYLFDKFGLLKAGSAKSFVTIFENKDALDERLLSSMLFCETYYENGTGLSSIVDADILSMVESKHGISQYDYADVIINSNVVIQMSTKLFNTIEARIIKNSITIFYIELVLFEESAIYLADSKIKAVLSRINDSTPNGVLKEYGEQLREYASTIDFWDIQMNYPSSKVAVDNNRKYFKIEKLLTQYKRDQEIFQKIYETKSDYTDRFESAVLTTIGAGLTTISILQLVWNTAGYYLLVTAGVIVGLLYILKSRILLRDRKHRKHNKRKK